MNFLFPKFNFYSIRGIPWGASTPALTPWLSVGGRRDSQRGNPPGAGFLRSKPSPPVGAVCCSDAEQMCVWAGVGWAGCQPRLHVFPGWRDPPKISLQFRWGDIEFVLQGKRRPLCNAAADEVMSLFQGTLQKGRSSLFLSSNILAYLFSLWGWQPGLGALSG